MIIRPLTPDFDRDEYVDLTVRSFGPSAEAAIRASLDPIVAEGGCPDADAALDGAFTATPFMLDGF